MNLSISNKGLCFMCGQTGKMTTHHTIPIQFKPLNNVCVPLCEPCHLKINSVDKGAVVSHLHKIARLLKEKTHVIKHLEKIITQP